jgi:hypothetical protein
MSDAAVASTKTAPPDKGGSAQLPCVSKCCVSVAGVVPDPTIRLCFSPGKGPFYACAVFILSLIAYFSSLDDVQLETMNKVSLVFTILSLVAALFLYFLGAFEFASLVHTVNGNTDTLNGNTDTLNGHTATLNGHTATLNDLRNYMFGDDEEKDRLRKEHIERKNKAAAVAAALFLRQQEAAEVASGPLLSQQEAAEEAETARVGKTTYSQDVELGQQRVCDDDEGGNSARHHGYGGYFSSFYQWARGSGQKGPTSPKGD